MKIAVVCANGKAGQLITKEAVNRGFDVTAFVRGENKSAAKNAVTKDLFDITKEDLNGYDVVVDACGGWTAETIPVIPKAGEYTLGGEELVLNSKGESVISYADYSIAFVDEIANGNHIGERISVVSK